MNTNNTCSLLTRDMLCHLSNDIGSKAILTLVVGVGVIHANGRINFYERDSTNCGQLQLYACDI